MKIIELKVHVLISPLDEPFYFSQGHVKQRAAVITEMTTDSGITGWGECLCHGMQPPEIAASIIQHSLKPVVLGRDPFDVEVLWEEMYNRTRPFGQAGAAVNAISGVDIAIWDVIGQACNQPVHKLLGGAFRTSVISYATGFYRLKDKSYPEAAIEEAKYYLQKGYQAMKLKIGFGINEDIRYIYSIRDAIGPDVKLMADANCAYDSGSARRLLYECKNASVYFFEELLAPEDLEGYQSLRNLTSAYLAAGENLFGKIGYRQWISKGALDILQPDLCSSGGFTECKKIAALAQAWNTRVIPHVWGSGIGLAASLQFIASLPPTPLSLQPEEPMLEYDQSSHPFRNDLIFHDIQSDKGRVQISQKAGLGVKVNRDVINEYAIENRGT